MRIDWWKPIRLVATARRVYVTGKYEGAWEARHVGPDDRWGSGGLIYTGDGMPLEAGGPWGPIENFDPAAEMTRTMDAWHDVPTPAEQRAARLFREKVAAASEDNPNFGTW